MNLELINTYKIKIENKIFVQDGIEKKRKSLFTDPQIISTFFLNWKPNELNEELIPLIEEALNNVNSELESGNEIINIFIYHDHVNFHDFYGNKEFSMPILDFKEIVIMWRDFLLEPPLDETTDSLNA